MSERTPKVTAVIVTYESRETIGPALDALREAHDAGLADAVIVDNASTDGTADYVAQQHPWVTLVRSDENLGYGRGCNQGFEHVATEYVLILNPDAAMDSESLRTLVSFMEDSPQAGITAPAILEGGEDSLQPAGLMTTPGTLLRGSLGSGQPYSDRRPIEPGGEQFRTNWLCGAAMLIRSDLFRALGGFDPRFFLYFEETDLCRRAAEHGAELWAVGKAVARHVGGASAAATGEHTRSSCIAEHYYRSRFYYLVKHFGWARAVGTEAAVVILDVMRRWRDRLMGRISRRRASAGHRPMFRFPAPPRDVRNRTAA